MDLGLTIMDLGVIIYLVFLGVVDKKTGSPAWSEVKPLGKDKKSWFL
jgi:hypothetical protein